ncbi:hypothetical protein T02_1913 [Trichinella nativa]|uniref:Uncharacterized protein n=1 Tax=Trichinella nativa TaxID=6335 RepID=A0A0V1LIU5_9BILA|nr:hypothetical protein T02_1913 [Trichinella nativa]
MRHREQSGQTVITFSHEASTRQVSRATYLAAHCVRTADFGLSILSSEATPTGELGGQEKPDWLGGQQPDERGIDEEVLVTKKPE